MKLYRKKKVEIVVEAARAHHMIELIDGLGAQGYTVAGGVSGRGHQGLRDQGDIFDVFSNVLIIVIASEPVAMRIVEASEKALEHYAGVVYLSDVEVVRDAHF